MFPFRDKHGSAHDVGQALLAQDDWAPFHPDMFYGRDRAAVARFLGAFQNMITDWDRFDGDPENLRQTCRDRVADQSAEIRTAAERYISDYLAERAREEFEVIDGGEGDDG